MNKAITVMISSVGKRVELVQCLRKTFSEMKTEGRIIGLDVSNTAPALYFCDKKYIVSRCNSKNFISDIIRIAKKEKVDLIVPTIDTELPFLSANKGKIESKIKAKVMVSDLNVVETFFSKTKTAECFQSIGLNVPNVYRRRDKITKYPIIVKPDKGSAARGVMVIKGKDEYRMFLKGNNPEFIQEFIEGREITIDIFADFNGDLKSVSMRERIRVRDGEVQIGKTMFSDKIYKQIVQLCDEVKFIGGSTVQVIENKNGVYFIECNPRFGGGLPFTIYAGANSWEYLLKTYLDIEFKVKPGRNYRKNVIYSRYDQTIEVK